MSKNVDWTTFADKVYPVGSVIIRADDTDYSNFLGGTWVKFGEGRCLVGMDSSDEFGTIGKTGGEKEQNLRALIGAVAGRIDTIGYSAQAAVVNTLSYTRGISASSLIDEHYSDINHSTAVLRADGEAPSTIQPYITVNFWERTA